MLFLLLCDGMGSGAGAKRESAQAGKLVENFLRAGMEPGEAVGPSAPPWPCGEDGGSTTIDLLSFDLFSGRCCVHKQGAAPTYIRRGGQVKCAVGASLPAGIVTGRAARPDVHKFRGEPGLDRHGHGRYFVRPGGPVAAGRGDPIHRQQPQRIGPAHPAREPDPVPGEDDGTVLAARLDRSREK
ncbi:MAG: SpoIIE family protein phosphatase [Evtepia sp.]